MQGLFMHVERIPTEGESVRGWGYREPWDGGKVANVAVAAARLGAPVRLVTILGTDERSERWIAKFGSERIDLAWVVQVEGPMDVGPALLPPSRIPVVIAVTDLGERIDTTFVADRAGAFAGASAVVCALESPVDGVAAAFRLGREAAATTILNASPVTELPRSLLETTEILVVNEHEAEAYVGARADARRMATAVRDQFNVPIVVVTAGADGAAAACDDGVLSVPAPHIAVVDSTGAGDAFLGAFVAELRAGRDLGATLGFAVRAATYSCAGAHTMDGFPRRSDLETAS